MLRLSEIKLPLEHSESELESAIRSRLALIHVPADSLIRYTVFRRAHDARKRSDIKLTYIVDVDVKDEAAALAHLNDQPHCTVTPDMAYKFVAKAPESMKSPRPVVIGLGPCGLFAGLILAQMGFRPIILERGKAVRERTKDTWGLWRKNVLNPESNVQFGEGGAGTFSDGKLYSQIKDPKHYGRKVLEEFVLAGAPIWLAVGSSTVLAIVFNFFSYGGLVFGDTSHRLLPRFLVFYAFLGGLNFFLLRALIWAGLGPLWAQALLLPVLAGVGFVGMRRFVFGRGPTGSLRHLKVGSGET